jgi:hypothetical protein
LILCILMSANLLIQSFILLYCIIVASLDSYNITLFGSKVMYNPNLHCSPYMEFVFLCPCAFQSATRFTLRSLFLYIFINDRCAQIRRCSVYIEGCNSVHSEVASAQNWRMENYINITSLKPNYFVTHKDNGKFWN